MSLRILTAGLQTSIQGKPIRGQRHVGMPAAGAADCLSLMLANHLVGNPQGSGALEITLGPAAFEMQCQTTIAVTGAAASLHIDGQTLPLNRSHQVVSGSKVEVGAASAGCRSYLAATGTLAGQNLWGSPSTYMPAGLGGFEGRALRDGDLLPLGQNQVVARNRDPIPDHILPVYGNLFILRVTKGPERDHIDDRIWRDFLDHRHEVGSRSSRMGLALVGKTLNCDGHATMASAPVFPGTVQLPPDGHPIILGADAQTTGGYPRIAQIIRADRHLLGQIRPGASLQLVETSPDEAQKIYRAKKALLNPWLGAIDLW